jgi:hypothetical protein
MRPIAAIAIALLAAGCGVNSSLERLAQARHLSADLLVQFTRASDAANKAVMATTDEASIAFASQADEAKQAVQTDVTAIQPILTALGYADESRLVEEFGARFAAYREMDRRILDLAVENTNIKAQHLSFGAAEAAANAFADALDGLVPLHPADGWRVKAVAATAVAAVRHLQALQAPHIASADDAEMSRLEQRMADSGTVAREGLNTITPLVQAESRPKVTAAGAALDRFLDVNTQITALSRRNTNVRSLALSLNEKGKVTRDCEESLNRLRDALSKRELSGTR